MMFSMRKVLVKTATIAPAKVKWEAQLKALNMMQGVYRFWSISYGLWIFIYVFCLKLVFWRKLILRTFKVQCYIQTIVNLKTIVDHCPQNFENHRKTIDTNGWALKKTFNGDGPTLSKPSKNHWSQWWPEKKINHSIALKNWPSLWSNWFISLVLFIVAMQFHSPN